MRLCAVAGCAVLLASYLGAVHPIGDSFAVFRLWIAGGVAVLGALALMVRARWIGAVGLVAGLFGAVPIGLAAQGRVPPSIDAPLGVEQTLYQKNLLWLNQDPQLVLDEIAAFAPDHVTLQEVHPARTVNVLRGLPDAYVSRHRCDFGVVGTVAVASRHPIVPGSEFCDWSHVMAAIQVVTPDGPLWVVSLHMTWPYPFDQAEQVEALAPFLAQIIGPAVIAGDFNMVPWSHTVRHIARETDTHLIGPTQGTRPTSPLRLNLAIDHVLVTGGQGGVEYRPYLWSDHAGLLARFRVPVESEEAPTD